MMESVMTTKTLLLATATVLSLGVGSAFAAGDGSANSYNNAPYSQAADPSGGRSNAMTPAERPTGQAAGDATQRSRSQGPVFFSDGAGG